MGRSRLYADAYLIWKRSTQAKKMGGVQNVLDGYIPRARRRKQVDGREFGIWGKFSNGIGNTRQKIGCGNGKPRGDYVN